MTGYELRPSGCLPSAVWSLRRVTTRAPRPAPLSQHRRSVWDLPAPVRRCPTCLTKYTMTVHYKLLQLSACIAATAALGVAVGYIIGRRRR